MPTIEELEGVRWPDPGEAETVLVRRCLSLRKKPLDEFSVEDLRVMLGQRMAVAVLLPRAIEVLQETPLAEGDYYPGDLLHAVVQLPGRNWKDLEAKRRQLARVLTPLIESDALVQQVRPAVIDFVTAAESAAE